MAKGVGDFIGEQNRYELMLAEAMGWDFVEGQGKGSGIDFLAPDGTGIECKFDWDSIKTGNHYLEFAQTSDGGTTWVPSGFSISAGEADLWVVVNEEWMRTLAVESVKRMITENRSELRTTRRARGSTTTGPGSSARPTWCPTTFWTATSFPKSQARLLVDKNDFHIRIDAFVMLDDVIQPFPDIRSEVGTSD